MNLQEIRDEIIRLSGSGKRVSTQRTHGIYTTFTLDGLDDMQAVRDTKQRFSDFGVPERLDGKSVIDVGANVGAVSFEFVRRGAIVTGVEYRGDRVQLMRNIAEYYVDCGHVVQGDHHQCQPHGSWWHCLQECVVAPMIEAAFHEVDLNNVSTNCDWASQQYDIVWCSSVDEYISDLPRFYALLRKLCRGAIYLESNLQGRDSEIVAKSLIEEAGFDNLEYLGNGHSGGISRKRKLFRHTPSDVEKGIVWLK